VAGSAEFARRGGANFDVKAKQPVRDYATDVVA
jgi:hypothetical protein